MNEDGTILFAEDDDNDAFFFEAALEKAGVHNPVVRTRNGEQALHYLTEAICGEHPLPCLLITDLKMPRLSGFDLLHQARAVLAENQIPAIVITASVADSDKERSLQLGARAFFTKPSKFEGFIALATELKQFWLVPLNQRA